MKTTEIKKGDVVILQVQDWSDEGTLQGLTVPEEFTVTKIINKRDGTRRLHLRGESYGCVKVLKPGQTIERK